MKRIGLFLLILCCVTACSTAQPAPISTEAPSTDLPPTPTPAPTKTLEAPLAFSLNFNENGCTSDIPRTLPAGKHSFLIKNNTDTDFALWVVLLPEDTTFQDLLDKQGEPGKFFPGAYDYRPPTKLAQRWDDSLGGKFYTFSFSEEGEYVAALGGLNDDSLWFCAPFDIAVESANQ